MLGHHFSSFNRSTIAMSCETFCISILQLVGTGVVCMLAGGLLYVIVKAISDDLKGKNQSQR